MTYFEESNIYTKQIDFTIIKGIANFVESDKDEICQCIKKKKLEADPFRSNLGTKNES